MNEGHEPGIQARNLDATIEALCKLRNAGVPGSTLIAIPHPDSGQLQDAHEVRLSLDGQRVIIGAEVTTL